MCCSSVSPEHDAPTTRPTGHCSWIAGYSASPQRTASHSGSCHIYLSHPTPPRAPDPREPPLAARPRPHVQRRECLSARPSPGRVRPLLALERVSLLPSPLRLSEVCPRVPGLTLLFMTLYNADPTTRIAACACLRRMSPRWSRWCGRMSATKSFPLASAHQALPGLRRGLHNLHGATMRCIHTNHGLLPPWGLSCLLSLSFFLLRALPASRPSGASSTCSCCRRTPPTTCACSRSSARSAPSSGESCSSMTVACAPTGATASPALTTPLPPTVRAFVHTAPPPRTRFRACTTRNPHSA